MRRKILIALAAGVLFGAPAANAQNTEDEGVAGAGCEIAGAGEKRLTRRQRFDRGLAFDTRTPSMPRGMWVAGISGAYSQHDNRDYGLFILDALGSTGNTLSVSPMVHYVFANNQSIGVRMQYRHSLFDVAGADMHLTSELSSMLLGDGGMRYRYESDNLMGIVSYRYYVGLGTSRRLLFFNEIQFGLGGGTGREDMGLTTAGDFRRSTWQKSRNFRLGFSPGATVFVTNHAAIELQIGLLGYEYQHLTQETTTAATTPAELNAKPRPGSRTTHNLSARFDLLSIAFGATFYL